MCVCVRGKRRGVSRPHILVVGSVPPGLHPAYVAIWQVKWFHCPQCGWPSWLQKSLSCIISLQACMVAIWTSQMVQGWWPAPIITCFWSEMYVRTGPISLLSCGFNIISLPACEHTMVVFWDLLVWHHCHYPFLRLLSLSLSILRWQTTSRGQCQPRFSSSNCRQWPPTIRLRLASPSHSLILFSLSITTMTYMYI